MIKDLSPWKLFQGFCLGALAGFLVFFCFFSRPSREIDSSEVEKCLRVFIDHKKSGDSEALKKKLQENKIEPAKFEKIIDRFLYFRMRQSALDQAMKLLEAFKGGADIVPQGVFSKSDEENTGFVLDAQILTVMKEKPGLVKEAFDG